MLQSWTGQVCWVFNQGEKHIFLVSFSLSLLSSVLGIVCLLQKVHLVRVLSLSLSLSLSLCLCLFLFLSFFLSLSLCLSVCVA